MNVRFAPEAADDLQEAMGWYSAREPSLGLEFLSAVARVIRRIGEFPESGHESHDAIRRIPLRRFPYFVFYALDADGAVVLGCLHAHRDPRIWPRRGP